MNIPKELQTIVHESVKILGFAIKEVYGEKYFLEIEKLRIEMKKIRNKNADTVHKSLEKTYRELKNAKQSDLHLKAKSFSLMLELINTCEASYRTYRLEDLKICQSKKPHALIFVLTSHPTEARSPQFLFIMGKIEHLILKAFQTEIREVENEILYLLKIAIRIDLGCRIF